MRTTTAIQLAGLIIVTIVILSNQILLSNRDAVRNPRLGRGEDGKGGQGHINNKRKSKKGATLDADWEELGGRTTLLIPRPNGPVRVKQGNRDAFPGIDAWHGQLHLCGDEAMIDALRESGALEAIGEDFTQLSKTKVVVEAKKSSAGHRVGRCDVRLGPLDVESECEGSPSEATRAAAYSMTISQKGVQVGATTWVGVTHALYTLLQSALMFPEEGSKSKEAHRRLAIPPMAIQCDAPQHEWRGQHFDTARHFFDVPYIKTVLSRMAMLKLNKFHWHLTDEQGWRLESKLFPELHTIGGRRGPSLNGKKFKKYDGLAYPEPKFHTIDDVKEVVRYAAARGIEVIPEIDLPAHASALVVALMSRNISAGYVMPASMGNDDCAMRFSMSEPLGAPNCMGGVFGMIDPTDDGFKPIESLIDEVCEIFSESTHIHLGGDEAEYARQKLWGDKWFGFKMKPNLDSLQATTMDKLIAVVHKHKKIPMIWDETLLELGGYTPPDPIKITFWRDDRKTLGDFKKRFDAMGRQIPVVFVPKTRLYFDYLQHKALKDNKVAPLQRPPPWAKYQAVTLKRGFMVHGSEYHGFDFVIGVQSALWTELIKTPAAADYQLFPRLFATADGGWCDRSSDAQSLASQYRNEFKPNADRLLGAFVWHPL